MISLLIGFMTLTIVAILSTISTIQDRILLHQNIGILESANQCMADSTVNKSLDDLLGGYNE